MITVSTQMKEGEKARFPYGSPAAPRCHGGEEKASAIFNAPLSRLAPRQPAPDTGCRARWGCGAEAKRQKETENKDRATRAGDREGARVSTETDIQGNGLGAKRRKGKGGKIWKYCFALCFLPLQAPLPFNAFSYKLPCFSHLRVVPTAAFSYLLLGCISLPKFHKTFASSKSQFLSQSLLWSSITREKISSCSWMFSVTKNIIRGAMEGKEKKSPAKHQLC